MIRMKGVLSKFGKLSKVNGFHNITKKNFSINNQKRGEDNICGGVAIAGALSGALTFAWASFNATKRILYIYQLKENKVPVSIYLTQIIVVGGQTAMGVMFGIVCYTFRYAIVGLIPIVCFTKMSSK